MKTAGSTSSIVSVQRGFLLLTLNPISMNEKDVYAEMKAKRNHKKVLSIFQSIETDAKLSLYVQELRQKYPNMLCMFERADVKGIQPTHYYQQLLIDMLEYYKRECTFEVSATGQHYLVKIPESKMNP